MSIQVTQRPFIFAGLEVTYPMTVAGGTDLSARDVVKVVLGKNDTAATIDGVNVGDYFTDKIVAASNDDYPESGDSDNDFPTVGILLAATVDDADGIVFFRGFLKDVTLTIFSTGDVWEKGDFVIFNHSADRLEACKAANVMDLDTGDQVVGKILEDITTASGAATVVADCWLDFINPTVATDD